MPELTEVRIASRFCGPPASGNGGYSCGLLAAPLDSTAEVTLEAPPPLDRVLRIARSEDGLVELFDDERGTRIARAKRASLAIEVPAAPTFGEALDAAARYIGREKHDYPTCFVCGPARTSPDGLALSPGALPGRPVVAAAWEPSETLVDAGGLVPCEIVWASLDCPSFFGHASFAPVEERVLLGRLTADVQRRPSAGERCVIAGWSIERKGRKIRCGSALYGETGDVYARAEAIWICVAR